MRPRADSSTCLDENQVLALVQGTRAPAELESLRAHVEGCALCQDLVALSARELGGDDGCATTPAQLGGYELVEVIGYGGSSVVYKARERTSGRWVALKTVRVPAPGLAGATPETRQHSALRSSLRREVHALARLRHPAIVRIFDDGVSTGRPWYAMELLEGETLADLKQRLWHHGAPARVAAGQLGRVLAIARRLCEPLAYLHGEGVVHRDLTPQNVFLRPDDQPVLVDFGLAGLTAGAAGRERAEVPQPAGTPAYVAPEQLAGELVDARTDLYAFGCVLYELVAGRTPFVGERAEELVRQHRGVEPPPLSQWVSDTPPGLERLLVALLAKSPRQRLGYIDDVAEALERLGAPPPAPAYVARRRPTVYRPVLRGREAALAEVREVVAMANGRGGMVLVFGESGIGKSYLVAEVARHARALRVVHGSGAPLEAGTPGALPVLGPLQGLVDAVVDHCGGGDEVARRLLGAHAATLARLDPRLGAWVDADAAAPPAVPAESPDAAREQLLTAVRAVLHALAREWPLLLVLDDLHWADELTLRLLASLDDDFFAAVPLAIIGTVRSEECPPALAAIAARVRRVELGRLDAERVRDLVVDMLAWETPPSSLVEQLAQQSEGNPFFVAEYLRTAVSEGLVRRQAGGWVADLDATLRALPPTLRELIDRRLDGLGAAERRACEAAAVLGRDFDVDLLEAALPRAVGDAAAALATLVQRQILEGAEAGRLRFVHHKVQEIAYQRIEAGRRAPLHRAAAVAIEARYGGEVPAHFAALGHHWAHAGETARAQDYWERAGDHALGVAAYELAAQSFGRARELGAAPSRERRAYWELGLQRARFGLGDPDAVEEHGHAALELLGFGRPRTRAEWMRALAHQVALRLPALARLVRHPAPLATRDDLRTAALAAGLLSQRYFYLDDMMGMITMVLTAIHASERGGAGSVVPRAYANMGGLLRLFRARRLSERYLARARSDGDVGEQAWAWAVEVVMEGTLGRWREAEAPAARLRELLPRLRDPFIRQNVITTLCHYDFVTGRYAAAQQWAAELLASARRSDNAQHVNWGLYFVACCQCQAGEWAPAIALLEEARRSFALHPEKQSEINCGGILALALVQVGRHGEAEALADATLALIERSRPTGFPSLEGYVAVAEVYRALAPRLGRRVLARRQRRIRRALWSFAAIFPCALPAALLESGHALKAARRRRLARLCFALSRRHAARAAMAASERAAAAALADYG